MYVCMYVPMKPKSAGPILMKSSSKFSNDWLSVFENKV